MVLKGVNTFYPLYLIAAALGVVVSLLEITTILRPVYSLPIRRSIHHRFPGYLAL